MKHTIKFFTAALLLAVLWSTSLVTTAQTPKTDEQIDLKAEEREVQKFADSFMQSLDETKDLDKVPEKFFVADFKTRFAEDLFPVNKKLAAQLSETERYEHKAAFLNFIYLGIMYSIGNNEEFKDDSEDENENNDYVKETLAPEAFKIFEKSKILHRLFDNSDSEIQNLVELKMVIKDLKLLNEAQRKYLNERSSEWKEIYARNKAKLIKNYNVK
jgi:hypothetical protein